MEQNFYRGERKGAKGCGADSFWWTYSNFFYNLAHLSKKAGIKFNIAMIYLVDEMFKNKHKTFTVKIGKPIPWQTFDKSKTPTQWAEYVKEIVYNL